MNLKDAYLHQGSNGAQALIKNIAINSNKNGLLLTLASSKLNEGSLIDNTANVDLSSLKVAYATSANSAASATSATNATNLKDGNKTLSATNAISMYNWYTSITGNEDETNKTIDKWNEIINFLSGIDDSSTLNNILNQYKVKNITAGTGITVTSANSTYTITNSSPNVTSKLLSGDATTASTQAVTSNPYIKLQEGSTINGKVQLVGSGSVSIKSDANGVITISGTDTNTNTASAVSNILEGSNVGTAITYKPYTSQQSKLSFDTSSTNPARTDRLNLNGYLYATRLYSEGVQVLTSHQSLSNYVTLNSTQTITGSKTFSTASINSLTAGNFTVTGASALGTINSGMWNASTISVSKGGTGKTTFTSGALLLGNGTGAIAERSIASSISVSTSIPTSTAVKTYVDNSVSKISNVNSVISNTISSISLSSTSWTDSTITLNNKPDGLYLIKLVVNTSGKQAIYSGIFSNYSYTSNNAYLPITNALDEINLHASARANNTPRIYAATQNGKLYLSSQDKTSTTYSISYAIQKLL